MKMNRAQLKEMIKECLVEILSEGIGSGPAEKLDEARVSRRPSLAQAALQPRRAAPHVAPRQAPLVQAANILAAGNPQMARIFADTAQTTLPTIMSAQDPESSQRALQQYMQEAQGNQYAESYDIGQQQPLVEDYPNLAAAPPSQVWDALAFGPPKIPHPTSTPLPKEFLDRKIS